MRKKTISLLVVLTFLMTLFPLALPAFAADYSRMGAVVAVDDDDVFPLNRVRMEFDAGELEDGASVLISLPNGFEFREDDDYDSDVMETSDWPGTYNYFSVTEGTATVDVTMLADNEIKVEVTGIGTGDVTLMLNLGAIYIDEDFEGDIPLEFYSAKKGFDDGSVVVGRVTGGEVTVTVTDDEAFGDGGGDVTLRLREDRAGAFDDDAESVKITLPKGFEWADNEGYVTTGSKPTTDYYAWLVDGDDAVVDDYYIEIDKDELILDTSEGGKTNQASIIEIKARIIVEDETRAKAGDVVAKVSGESDVTPSTLTGGTYGDFDVKVSAGDSTTVYAGFVQQEIADITIEEAISGSLVAGRSVTLTLPDMAKWGDLPKEVSDNGCVLELVGFPGGEGDVAKYNVKKSGNSAAELEFDDLEIILSPKMMPGEMSVSFGGSAGVKGEVKVAEIAKPVAMKFENVPTVSIGLRDQALAEITITEAEAGLINEDKPLVLILPKDIPWESYEVDVIAGDLEIGRVETMMHPISKDEYLIMNIERDSDEASSIRVTASVDILRSIPEGGIIVGLGGQAIVEIQDQYPGGALEDQYGATVGGYYQIAGFNVMKQKNLYLNHDTVGGGYGAKVGTPAPGEIRIKAVFTLGSTNYTLNDVAQTMDVAPYAKNGRTYLPMRYVAKALGIPDSGILWNNGTATFVSADRVVSVTVGSNTMYINGAPVPIDVAPEIVNGRTMLPIRWVAAAFGIDVAWDAETQTVTVN